MTKIYGSKILGSQQNFATFITKNTEFVLMKNKEENKKKNIHIKHKLVGSASDM